MKPRTDNDINLPEFFKKLTPEQLAFFNRVSRRIRQDDGFENVMKNNAPLLSELFYAGNIRALDRWLRRKTLKAV